MTETPLTAEKAAALIENNSEIMKILEIITTWHLPDCWLVAGTLRNFLWDYLANSTASHPANDVDVAFFDPSLSYLASEKLAETLAAEFPGYNWEIKNQAQMHQHNFPDGLPYQNTLDAVSKYPETCTALACRLNSEGKVEFYSLWGVADLANFAVRPTPFFRESPEKMAIYQRRVQGKKWQEKWPQITLEI